MRKILCEVILVAFSLSISGCVGMMMPEQCQVVNKACQEAGKGKQEKAIKRLEEYQKTHPNMPPNEMGWQKCILAQCYAEIGKTSTAISILDKFLEEQPYQEDGEIYFQIARLYLKQGDKQKAEAMFKKEEWLANINSRLRVGWQYEEAKELDEAMEIYIKISHDVPYCYQVYNCIGHVYCQKGDMNQAISNYEKTLELNPAQMDTGMYLGALYAISGKKDKAKQIYEKVVKDCQWKEAVKEAKAIITFLDSDAYAAFLQDEEALKYIQSGDMNAAIEACKEKITQEPKTLKWHFYLACVYSIKEDNKEAKEEFKKVISISPDSEEAKLSKTIMRTLADF